MSNEVAVRQESAVSVSEAPESLLSIIARVATDPRGVNVDAMERLLAMQERIEAQSRKEKFDEALLRVQRAAPRIRKDGLMDRGPGKGQIAFARREDIDAVMRPIYQAEGFSVTWNSPMGPDGKIRVIGTFSAFGHSEQREWSCSPDTSGGKQNPQAAGSTVSYGQRYISKMFWDIVEEGEDTNGATKKDMEPITQNQADDLRVMLNDLPQRSPGFLVSRICAKYGVERLEAIRKSQWAAVMADVHASQEKLKK